jgi:hypothetical protein
MQTNFKQISTTKTIDDLKYLIIDTESMKHKEGGYFSFQFRNESQTKEEMIEMYSDNDCYEFYKKFINTTRPMYDFSINYDKTMLASLIKLVELEMSDITKKLRRVNDYIIPGNVNFFDINTEFWTENYYPNIEKYTDKKDLFKYCIENLQNKYKYEDCKVPEFLEEFPYLLGQSKNFKNKNIIDVPILLGLFTIRKGNKKIPTISLKNLQLYEEGYNITHDFETIFDIDKIKELGLFEDFKKYSLNDVGYLFRLFFKHCLPIIKQRFYACKAIQKFNPDFIYTDDMIHSEKNTNLLISAFSLPENEKKMKEKRKIIKNKKIDFNKINESIKEDKEDVKIYDYIKPTGYKKFDDFVDYVKKNYNIKKDKDLKTLYCEKYNVDYHKDDKTIEEKGKYITIVDKFNVFDIFKTEVSIGMGGLHGAIKNLIIENMFHLDYRSLYPSIILAFRRYFEKIINVNLYKALYDFRNFEVKPNIEKIKKEILKIYEDIEKLGNDMHEISKLEKKLESLNLQKKELENLSDGAKLLLNSLYGLINSEFSFSISNKILGRFICLYGQYRSIELCKLIKKESPLSNLININTDGIIIDNVSENIVKEICSKDIDEFDYIVLNYKSLEKLIQIDVNNYMKIEKGVPKTKGNSFSTGLKQAFNKTENIDVNMKNAKNIIVRDNQGKKDDVVQILPILFHTTKAKSTIRLESQESSRNKVYYLTNKKHGEIAAKNIAKPTVISIDNEIMYFTEDKNKADIEQYKKFAKLTVQRILEFRLTQKDNIPFMPVKLKPDSKKAIAIKKEMRRIALKCFRGHICYHGLIKGKKNTILTEDKITPKNGITSKINPLLSNYTMSKIRDSKECMGISLKNNDSFIFITTNDKNTQSILESNNIPFSKHKSGIKLYLVKKIEENYKNIKILEKEYVPVHSIDGEYTLYLFNKPLTETEGV